MKEREQLAIETTNQILSKFQNGAPIKKEIIKMIKRAALSYSIISLIIITSVSLNPRSDAFGVNTDFYSALVFLGVVLFMFICSTIEIVHKLPEKTSYLQKEFSTRKDRIEWLCIVVLVGITLSGFIFFTHHPKTDGQNLFFFFLFIFSASFMGAVYSIHSTRQYTILQSILIAIIKTIKGNAPGQQVVRQFTVTVTENRNSKRK